MMEGSAKLYHLCVDIGEEKLRNVLAGIKEFFSPEELVGQKVIIVSNLEPKKMRGIVSEGMILMTDTEEGKPVFVVPEENVPLGSLLR